ncbi:MAG: MBL fold metallo-hydrolase [Candidatus Woesearchaeota archaeon]
MQQNIIFLGTGQGSQVVGKQLRASGGIVIQSGEHQLHLDPGPGSLNMGKICGINPRATTALLVSHSHLRHCNDLNLQIDAMTYSGLDKRGVLIADDALINQGGVSEFYKGCLEKYMVLKPGQKVAIDDIEIKATTTSHSVQGIGFKILAPSFCVSYLGDTGFCSEILEEHAGTEIMILNVVNPANMKSDNNLNSEDAIKIIRKLKPNLAIITHFSLKMLEADPIQEARNINSQTKSQVIAAKDGMVINPLGYASKSRQKRLDAF